MINPEPQRPYVGVHLLLIHEDKVLLMKRTVKDEMDGLYALVAGKVDHQKARQQHCAEKYMKKLV
jgi:ADP-ribose pyrophosphatase YjhB (NUDIX family)